MAPKPLPSQRLLKRVFSYCPETGRLLWNERPSWMFTSNAGKCAPARRTQRIWNRRYAGTEAGSVKRGGYREVRLFGRSFWAHRIIWKIVFGFDPITIDHLNRNPSDNRICNLRSVTHHKNCLNRGPQSKSISGVSGVRWLPHRSHWVALISIKKKVHYLGSFPTRDEAVCARLAAENIMGFSQT